MISRPPLVFASVAVLLALASGCAERRAAAVVSPAAGDAVGVYRGQAWDGGRRTRFHLLLHARVPDHIHAELSPPVGGTAWILDSGEGRLSLTVVEEGTAYVGPSGAQVVARLLGIAVSPSTLVRSLLDGEAPGGSAVATREPAGTPGLPLTFELRDADRGFRLERLTIKRALTRGLATGTPPAGVRVVPLEELDAGPGYD